MKIDAFDTKTTQRLSISLILISGTLIFATFDLIGTGITSNNYTFSKAISNALPELMLSGFFGLVAFIFSEISNYQNKVNKTRCLKVSFVCLIVGVLFFLLLGGVELISSVATNIPNSEINESK